MSTGSVGPRELKRFNQGIDLSTARDGENTVDVIFDRLPSERDDLRAKVARESAGCGCTGIFLDLAPRGINNGMTSMRVRRYYRMQSPRQRGCSSGFHSAV